MVLVTIVVVMRGMATTAAATAAVSTRSVVEMMRFNSRRVGVVPWCGVGVHGLRWAK
jgi:hypothetical protein